MKWYNYEQVWVNLDRVDGFVISKKSYPNEKDGITICFHFGETSHAINFTPSESETELEKIKELMGIKSHTSRCC